MTESVLKQCESIIPQVRAKMRQWVRHYQMIGDPGREAKALDLEAAWQDVEGAYLAVMSAKTKADNRKAVLAYYRASAVLDEAYMDLTGDRLDEEMRQ